MRGPPHPNKMSLSIIIPTIGRPSLANTLTSLLGQLNSQDEVILVHDGPIENTTCKTLIDTHFGIANSSASDAEEWWCLDGRGVTYHVIHLLEGPHNDWGATARNIGLSRVNGDHILFMDDDDRYTFDGLDKVRKAINADPQAIYLFQMRCKDGQILWRDRELRCGNVGTPMLCFPRTFRYNKWKMSNTHDFQFIDDLVHLNSNHMLVWEQEVIAFIQH